MIRPLRNAVSAANRGFSRVVAKGPRRFLTLRLLAFATALGGRAEEIEYTALGAAAAAGRLDEVAALLEKPPPTRTRSRALDTGRSTSPPGIRTPGS